MSYNVYWEISHTTLLNKTKITQALVSVLKTIKTNLDLSFHVSILHPGQCNFYPLHEVGKEASGELSRN